MKGDRTLWLSRAEHDVFLDLMHKASLRSSGMLKELSLDVVEANIIMRVFKKIKGKVAPLSRLKIKILDVME